MPIILQQFTENLVKSGLMTAEEVASLQDNLQPKDARGFARELVKTGALTKYQAAAVYQGKTKGLVLGEYVVLEKIGAGGMGEVLKARHRRMDRLVAIKVLPAKTMKSPDAVSRFQREVRAAAKLEHANIVTAYDAGESEGIHFLAMQFVDGQDLASLVQEHGPLSVEQAVEVTIQAAKGLDYAHGLGVVHRDVKPGNLLLHKDGTVKILDMGLARLGALPDAQTAVSEHLTGRGQVLGTCEYMAPEQAEDTHSADHRADIYSLGCALYRLLTGDTPYKGDTLITILLAHREGTIPSLCEARPDVPGELDAVYQKMLSKNPEDRYQSMAEVVTALETCLTPEPVGGAAESSTDSALRNFLQNLPQTSVAAEHKPKPGHEETMMARVEEETAGGVGEQPAVASGRKKRMLVGIGGGAIGLVLLVVLVMALSGGGDQGPDKPSEVTKAEEKTPKDTAPPRTTKPVQASLIIHWPEQDRAGAKLDLDGEDQDIAELQHGLDQLRVSLNPGDHTVWLARRGYEPFERKFAVEAGEEFILEPVWKEFSPEVASADVEPESQQSEPTMEPESEPEASTVAQAQPPPEPEPETVPSDETADAQPAKPPATTAEIDPALKRQQELEAKFTKTMEPVEAKVAEWDFIGAATVLNQVRFDDKELTTRLSLRREELQRLAKLKERIVAKIQTADPPLKKTELKLHGMGGNVTGADDAGITATLISGKEEMTSWNDLSQEATSKVLQLVIDRNSGDDWLAGGLLAFTTGDATLAEELFDQAAANGMNISPYLITLASASFSKAVALLAEKEFLRAVTALEHVREKYGRLPWFEVNRKSFDVALSVAKDGAFQSDAEQLYQKAAELFEKEQLFDLREVVGKLKLEYAESRAVTDENRKPSLTEMADAIANLGRKIIVRLDGKGDFTSIQMAVENAPSGSLIEIQDDGPYNEKILIPPERSRLIVRGIKGRWPVITWVGPKRDPNSLIAVQANEITLERLTLINVDIPSRTGHCVYCVEAGPITMRSTISFMRNSSRTVFLHTGRENTVEGCLFLTDVELYRTSVRDSLALGGIAFADNACRLRSSTVASTLLLRDCPTTVVDSIIGEISLNPDAPDHEIQNCAFIASRVPAGSENSFAAIPQFPNPNMLDYSLAPTSPCKGKASDGGDLGVRYTPEMIEMCQIALKLRAQGVIDF
jgi:serine/threonine protein kinase/tetratricopeptide (TPR) repeat protein